MILLEDHQGGQEFRVIQRAPAPHEGLRRQNPQGLALRRDAAEMRFPSPDRDNDLTRHAVALLDAIESGGPLPQEIAPAFRKGGELSLGEIAARALELRLPLIVGRSRPAGRLKFGKIPIEPDRRQAALERLPGDALLLRIGPDRLREPVPELRLGGRARLLRLSHGCYRQGGAQNESRERDGREAGETER